MREFPLDRVDDYNDDVNRFNGDDNHNKMNSSISFSFSIWKNS